MSTIHQSLQHYLDGHEAFDGLAHMRPYLVAGCLGDDLLGFMLTLEERADQPTLLRRLMHYAEAQDEDFPRRFEAAKMPLFSHT